MKNQIIKLNNERTKSMSVRLYIILLSLFTSFGLAVSAITAILTYGIKPGWIFSIGFIALSFIGVFMATSKDSIVSFIGYLMMTIGLGAITGPYIALYTTASVIQIFLLTLGVTLAIGIIGAIVPFSVSHWGGFLLTGLLVLIFAQFGTIILTLVGVNVSVTMTVLDWIGVFLFSLYIFYDMNQAMRASYSAENAMRFAISIYLNVMNLFLRLVSLFGDDND